MRLADFHITLLIGDDYDDRDLRIMVQQLNRLDLRRSVEEFVQDKLCTTKYLTTTLAVVEE